MQVRRIVVGSDFSDGANLAASHALAAARIAGAEVALTHAARIPEAIATRADAARIVQDVFSFARARLDRLRDRMAGQGAVVSGLLVEGDAAKALPRAAADLAADMVVVGHNGRSALPWVLLGTVAERTLRRADAHVLIARPLVRGTISYRRILVPLDLAPGASDRVLAAALALASPDARVDLLHCWELAPGWNGDFPLDLLAGEAEAVRRDSIEEAVARADELVEAHQDHPAHLTFDLEEVAPNRGIRARLDEGDYDLVVVGKRARAGGGLGAIAEATARYAPCSVLAVRPVVR